MKREIKPDIICTASFYDNGDCGSTSCPCYKENQEAFFRKKDGSVFTANEAITMLENTDVFNDNQNLLINVCLYAIKHCYPHIAKEERGGTNEQIH